MICPSMSIPASTELTEFLYISCSKKLPHHSFGAPSLLAPGAYQRVAHGPPMAAAPRIAGFAGSVVTPLTSLLVCMYVKLGPVYNLAVHHSSS